MAAKFSLFSRYSLVEKMVDVKSLNRNHTYVAIEPVD